MVVRLERGLLDEVAFKLSVFVTGIFFLRVLGMKGVIELKFLAVLRA